LALALKIYTKKGDKGETSLFGGKRLPKDSLRIETYGTIDELNSIIGVCRSMNTAKEVDVILEQLQNDLFTLGADLATPHGVEQGRIDRIQPGDVARLEHIIDEVDPKLQPLKQFVLPGGSRTAALLHFARTVCRRAERRVVQLSREETIGESLIVYLNRLSDLLFVLARWVNALSNTPEAKWNPT
jgi:cob(I)alamin adenosyltransferase